MLVLVLDISMECLNKKVNYVGNMNLNVMNIFCNFSMSSIGEPFLWHFLTFHTIMSLYLMHGSVCSQQTLIVSYLLQFIIKILIRFFLVDDNRENFFVWI